VSLASIVMVCLFPVIAYEGLGPDSYGMEVVWGSLAFALLVLWRHKDNIKRLTAGLEPNFKKRNKE
jgi:glycerol-3-phosphate acyltransferase PlsY